ncbi:hypothetical protein WMF20_03660 [Sorangium sp. So ce834]|uniref:hypothetical protein n=1 Tax=Sorangium sp. So ce834 TaxID=3133321 RepID=UPI003F5DAF1E
MIGGADIVLYGQTKAHDTDLLVRAIRTEWPNAVIQHADKENGVPIREFHFPVIGPAELIVYRDNASYQSWTSKGAAADNQDAMIHLIVADDNVTLVVDRPDSALADMARELLVSLRPNRIVLQAA